jgi:AraC family transcriptional regulator, regulatory protein of adaptative response / methylated-DNA-[protein]-cysteine methyltransferase
MATRTMLNTEECWRAVQQRDAAQDGQFVFGVITTGVYCRPSCPARPALRRNVRFYETPSAAERDGLRPCLRCRPKSTDSGRNSARIRAVCRYIEEHSDTSLTLRDLAGQAGLSQFHFQRVFRAAVGLTPRQYLEGVRLGKLKQTLRTKGGVTEAVYETGYGSSSRVYERSDARLGMTPRQYQRGGRDVVITHVTLESTMGLLMIGATDRGLCFVQFGDTREGLLAALRQEYPAASIVEMPKKAEHLSGWRDALRRHLAGQQPQLDLPLDIRATAFQMRVWRYLQSIPYGEVRSYRDVAAAIGQPKAARAVARACAGNTLALVIPCHRVIRGNGEAGGYRWGLERKRALLAAESAGDCDFATVRGAPSGP